MSQALLIPGLGGPNLQRQLFGLGEQGAWYRPDQFGATLTQYQDSAGTTPVTAVGQTVGLAIDWRLGRVLGPELVTNGGFTADTDWAKGANWTIGSGVATKTGGAANDLTQVVASTSLRFSRITLDVTRTAGTLTVSIGTSGSSLAITASGSYSMILFAGTSTQTLTLAGDSAFAGTVDNVSVRELPGNHAYQATEAERPLLACVPARGRVNLLIATEDLSQAAWVVSAATKTTQKVIPNTSNTNHYVTQPVTIASDQQYTLSFDIKADGYNYGGTYTSGWGNVTALINLTNGAVERSAGTDSVAVTALDDGWYRVEIADTSGSTTANVRLYAYNDADGGTFAGDGTSGVLFRNVQFELGSTATNYQRVGAGIYDVTEVGQPTLFGWLTDGVDDGLETNAIDATGGDKVTLVAGVRKLSDADFAAAFEFSETSGGNDGTFCVFAPSSPITRRYLFRSRGTASADPFTQGAAFTAPVSNVITGIGDISGDISRLRANGVQIGQDLTDQGTGNYGNHKLYIGARAGTSLFFNGYLFALCLRFAETDAALLSRLENFVAQKTIGTKL